MLIKNFENRLLLDKEKIENHGYLLGIDEVGWGPVAGPVCLGFCLINKEGLVQLKKRAEEEPLFKWVKDSKRLAEKKRLAIEELIKEENKLEIKAWASFGTVETINKQGLAEAYEEALQLGLEGINLKDTKIIIDGIRKPHRPLTNLEMIKKGDDLSWTIALASIFAKNKRDRYIEKIHREHQVYNWQKNKGYATAEHIEAIKKEGLSPHHRVGACKNFK